MSYKIVEEECTASSGNTFQYAIKENGYTIDRAKTLKEATKILEELEQYEKEQAYLEEEVGFLVDEFRNKFDLEPMFAEKRFVEYVKDWL